MKKQHYDLGEERDVQAKAKENELNHENDLNDLRKVLESIHGRRFVWSMLQKCGVYRTSFTGNSQTFFLEGKRSVGLELLHLLLMADPDTYLKMIKESKGETQNGN